MYTVCRCDYGHWSTDMTTNDLSKAKKRVLELEHAGIWAFYDRTPGR